MPRTETMNGAWLCRAGRTEYGNASVAMEASQTAWEGQAGLHHLFAFEIGD